MAKQTLTYPVSLNKNGSFVHTIDFSKDIREDVLYNIIGEPYKIKYGVNYNSVLHPFKSGVKHYIMIDNAEKVTFSNIKLLDNLVYRYKNMVIYTKVGGKTTKVNTQQLLNYSKFMLVPLVIPSGLAKSLSGHYRNEYDETSRLNKLLGIELPTRSTPMYWALRDWSNDFSLAKAAVRKVHIGLKMKHMQEFSCYDGDFLSECEPENATVSEIDVDISVQYRPRKILLVYGDTSKLSESDGNELKKLKCPTFYNCSVVDKSCFSTTDYSGYDAWLSKLYKHPVKITDEVIDYYNEVFGVVFGIPKQDVTIDVIKFYISSIRKDAGNVYTFLSLNVSLDYYLSNYKVLNLPNRIRNKIVKKLLERKPTVAFFEDHKDDEFEEINNKYLCEKEKEDETC